MRKYKRSLLVVWIIMGFYTDGIGDEVKKITGVKIPMRDGKQLMADITLPSSKGKFPTIYIHTPYKRESASAPLPDHPHAKVLLDREHYVYVITDWRGYFGSKEAAEGAKELNHGQDGYDVIEWIAKQPWSNGKVGLWGHSAPGGVQYKIAQERPPHLVCAVPASANIGYPYEQFFYGGVLQKHYLKILGGVGHNRKGRLGWVEKHPTKDWFWKWVGKKADPSTIDIPMLFITGWYDTHPELKIDTWKRLRGVGKKHSDDMKLIIGPWHHTEFGRSQQGILNFPEAEGVTDEESLRFFDYWLREKKDNGWHKEPAVRYFQMGNNTWHKTTSWPPSTVPKQLYFRANGRLTKEPPLAEGPDVFTYDPDNPVPTVGGTNLEMKKSKLEMLKEVDAGPQDLRDKVESRKDVIVYTTDIFSKDLEVVGVISVKLFVSSNCRDTDFAVRLSDVYPDGRSILVTDGIWRMRYRNSLEKEEFMIPHEIYEVTIPFVTTAQTFLKGHQIRLSVASSNYPRFDKHTNTIFPKRLSRKATHRIYHDQNHPSVLILPVQGTHSQNEKVEVGSPSEDGDVIPLGPGDYEFDLLHNQLRKYYVHVPASYDNSKPTPVVINFHGGGGSAEGHPKLTKMLEKSDRAGFIAVHPQGTGKDLKIRYKRFWNPGSGPTGPFNTNPIFAQVDDVGFVNKMLDHLESKFNIDKKRIYATGLSNGGIFTYKLACDLSHRIAAIASIGGPFWGSYENCKPSKAVSVLHFHGTSDVCAPYQGGTPHCEAGIASKGRIFPSIEETISVWRQINHCPMQAKVVFQKGEVTCQTFAPCDQESEVTLCTIEGGGHTWPGGLPYRIPGFEIGVTTYDINANDFMWEFFKRHPLEK